MQIAGIISSVGEKIHPTQLWYLPFVWLSLPIWNEEVLFMATNYDFSRSSLLAEQYQRDMELITISLQEETQDEREERLGLVARSWSLTRACFQAQLEPIDVPAFASSLAFAHP